MISCTSHIHIFPIYNIHFHIDCIIYLYNRFSKRFLSHPLNLKNFSNKDAHIYQPQKLNYQDFYKYIMILNKLVNQDKILPNCHFHLYLSNNNYLPIFQDNRDKYYVKGIQYIIRHQVHYYIIFLSMVYSQILFH